MDQAVYTTSKFVQLDDGFYSRLMRHFVITNCILYKDKLVIKELRQKDFQGFKLIKSQFMNPYHISDDEIPQKEEILINTIERIEFNQGDSLSPFFSITVFAKDNHFTVPGYTDELKELCSRIEELAKKKLLINTPDKIILKKSPPIKLIIIIVTLMLLYILFIFLTRIV